jgi:hypothetical protein
MISIQEELWNIYTYYSLRGNPRDPSHINATQFYKFCRDTLLFDRTMTDVPLTQAVAQLIFTTKQSQKRAGNRSASNKIDYTEFLSCLLSIAQRCYPSCTTPEEVSQFIHGRLFMPTHPSLSMLSLSISFFFYLDIHSCVCVYFFVFSYEYISL